MADVIELSLKGHLETVGFACGACGQSYVSKFVRSTPPKTAIATCHQLAASCCTPKLCPRCGVGLEPDGHCTACRRWDTQGLNAALLEHAKKIPESEYGDGVVYWDQYAPRGDLYWMRLPEGDGFAGCADDIRDWCKEEGVPAPDFVWACYPKRFSIDAEDAVEHARVVGGHPEETTEIISSAEIGELSDLLEQWCERINLIVWHVDYTRAVLLRR